MLIYKIANKLPTNIPKFLVNYKSISTRVQLMAAKHTTQQTTEHMKQSKRGGFELQAVIVLSA